MKRQGAREIDTPLGMFYGGIWDSGCEHGPEFYAETESGEITLNGVSYTGTVYARRYSHDGSLFLSVQHLTRWDDRRRHHYPASDSAERKLADALLPVFEDWSQDKDYVTGKRIDSLRSTRKYALVDANRAVGKANDLAAEIRTLGGECDDVARFPLEDDS